MTDGDWSPPGAFEEYRIVQPLGRGAMGQVYLAHDSLLDRDVAVKFPRGATDGAARDQFFREARAIARLQHPNVVAIYRASEVGGRPYLVSEYVRGRPLDEVARPLSSKQVLAIALDLTRGLAAAHQCGVLHRDVKPANAIIGEDGRAKLLDFGLAIIGDAALVEPALSPPRERTESPTRHLAAIDVTASSYQREPLSVADGSPPYGIQGTPLYAAPELWRGEPASRRSDLYSLGILLYELLAGVAPHRGVSMAELGEVVQTREVPRLGDIVAGVDTALAAIVDRLVERDPAARFGSADELLAALEEIAAPPAASYLPDGNPYRGLAAFDAQQGALFFGRRTEIRELVDRVRAESLVIVGGDSGTGKSSLCRAGVVPWLVQREGWASVDVVPGRAPMRALETALASRGAGPVVVLVDQLEEVLTLADAAEARAFATALASLASREGRCHVLATARSDFLSRLAMLPGLGSDLARSLYFLRPLTGDRIREAIVRPAAAKGVRFESDELVDALVDQTERAPGGLPLLQFTLAELWDARDADAKLIRADALAALGGVAGALSRHGDRVLAGLAAGGREAARQLLLRLVTAERTRARRSEAELLVTGGERAALEVLVRGRIVVANDGAYEIAHEALVASWPTLHDWLEESAADHVVRRRLEAAAAEWERSGFDRDLLWRRRRLADTRALPRESLGAREVRFVAASRRRLLRRRLAIAGAVALLAAATVTTGLVLRARAHRHLEAVIAGQLQEAEAAIANARELARQRDAARDRAVKLFDARQWPAGEDVWAEAELLGAREAARYREASSAFEGALALGPTRTSLREGHADLLAERLGRAERDRATDLAAELAGRLAAYGDRRHRRQSTAPAKVDTAVPPGIRVPASMVYVPAGSFLFGSADVTELRRSFLKSPPMHEVSTEAYLIARHEVTFREWIAFLDTLPADERKRRTPSSTMPQSSLVIEEVAPKQWRFTYVRATRTYQAAWGEPIRYEKRTRNIEQDWREMPVSAVSYEDALAYVSWLDRTRRVPGARLCNEHEWERAARGVDGRTFPTGETLAPDDANIDVTYGREPLAFGPDEVGLHPRSRSPYGVDDMAGNVWEWTSSVEIPGAPIARGGGFYNEALSARSTNREHGEPTQRHIWIGIRICATPPQPETTP